MAHARRWRGLVIVAAVAALLAVPGGSIAAPIADGSPQRAEHYKLQWNMKAMAAHALFSSQPEVRGSGEVLVAVVDTGIDYGHPDLGIRRHGDGSPGNGGLVDLVLSTSVLDRTPAGTTCPAGDPGMSYHRAGVDEDAMAIAERGEEGLVTDFHSHGTAVAGLIASRGGLLAGVTQRTTLFGVKVHGASRQNCLSVYLAGIKEAADRDADVIHLSIPLEFPRLGNEAAVERANEALTYAHDKGAVLVAAAGNATTNLNDESRFRFCQGAHVICVGATGPASPDLIDEPWWDAIAGYSNYGTTAIDVAGPGGTGTFPNQIVPVWLTCSQVTIVTTGAPGACSRGEREIWSSTGTSFGAAATSGLAALLKSIRPNATPMEIESLIEATAHDDPSLPGPDPYYGAGRIDVIEAVIAAQH